MDDVKLRELFDSIDADGSGKINATEAQAALRKIGIPTSNTQVKQFIKQVDTDGDGEIDWEEFHTFVKSRRKTMRELFDSIDKDGSGFLSHEEVFEALEKQGLASNPETTREILAKMDTDNSGEISFEEFEEFLAALPTLTSKDLFDVLRGQVTIDNGDGMSSATIYFAGGTRRPFQQIMASCFSGMVARSATSPLERVKVMVQTRGSGEKIAIGQIFKGIFKTEGLRGMFKGNGVNSLKLLGEGFIRFTTYDFISRWLMSMQDGRHTSVGQKFFAGSVAGLVTCGLTHPLETIRIRLVTTSEKHNIGATRTAINMVRNEGVTSLFRGIGPAMLAFIPYAGIDLALFDTMKHIYIHSGADGEEREPTPLVLLVCGGSSATAGQTVSYPLSLVRTKLQADGKGGTPHKFNGMADCFSQIWKQEGLRGFYRGFGLNFVKSVPSIAVSYAVADKIRRAFSSILLSKS